MLVPDLLSPEPSSSDAMAAFAELGRIDLAQTDLAGVLSKVAHLAAATVPGASEVSVTLLVAGVGGTAAHTGNTALALDERQYDAGYGPCLDAAAQQTVFIIEDTATEQRWPAFVADAAARGVCATLSVGIPIRQTVTGGLNMYALEPTVFDDEAVAIAKTFAGYAAVALANAHLYETTAALATQMAEAMASRAVIEQAKGIVIAQQHISADQAFEVMAKASQVSNRKLRDIAQAIVDGAQKP
jgi:GAF domain-containing protein